MKIIWISLILFVFIINTRGGLCYTCDVDAVSQCLEPLQNAMMPLYGSLDQYRFKKMSRDSIWSYCSIYNNEVSDCLAETAQTCTGYYQAAFEGFEDAFDYLCNEGFAGYIKHWDCFASNRTATKLNDCVKQVTTGTSPLQFDFLEEKACSVIDDGLDCIVDGIEDICEKEASVWMETFARKVADPLMEEMDCNTMDGPSDNRQLPTSISTSLKVKPDVASLVGIIVGSVVGVAVLVFLVSCLLCVALNKQKRIATTEPSNAAQTQGVQGPAVVLSAEKMGPPPSYSEIYEGMPVKHI